MTRTPDLLATIKREIDQRIAEREAELKLLRAARYAVNGRKPPGRKPAEKT